MGRTSDAKEKLVRGAMELFHGKGYRGVSIDDLCRQAGVKKGSFYYFFRSKRDLALSALDARWSLAESEVLQPIFGGQLTPPERFRAFFQFLADIERQAKETGGHARGCPYGNLSAELGAREPAIQAKVRGIIGKIGGYFRRNLEDWREHGGYNPQVDTETGALALVALMEGALLLARTRNDPEVLRTLGEAAVQLFGGDGPPENPAA